MTATTATESIAEGMFELGDTKVQNGEVLLNASLGWKSFGHLAPDRSNAILIPTSYAAKHSDLEWLIGKDGVFDPARWFIIIVDTFGNGVSSSPSRIVKYPNSVTCFDNVQAQRHLIQEQFGIERLACVYGWSMGGQQAYHWASIFPDSVNSVIINCGSARTSAHNRVFIAGLKSVLEAAPGFSTGGRFSRHPVAGLRAFGRVYAGWALSQEFYRQNLHLSVFITNDLEDYLTRIWESRFATHDASDLYAQLKTWEESDISNNSIYKSNFVDALRAISAPVLLMPSETDLYFQVTDNVAEAKHLRRAILKPIPSIWGHRAGNPIPGSPDAIFLRDTVAEFLTYYDQMDTQNLRGVRHN